jgi:hypothetical protein
MFISQKPKLEITSPAGTFSKTQELKINIHIWFALKQSALRKFHVVQQGEVRLCRRGRLSPAKRNEIFSATFLQTIFGRLFLKKTQIKYLKPVCRQAGEFRDPSTRITSWNDVDGSLHSGWQNNFLLSYLTLTAYRFTLIYNAQKFAICYPPSAICWK